EKVMKDCELCLRKDNCDEIAMDFIIKQTSSLSIPCKFVA
ncbi:argininosuccinate lyase, partial [Pseudoalteromonas phenolica]